MKVILGIPLNGKEEELRRHVSKVHKDLELLGFDVLNPLDIPFLQPFDWLDWSLRNQIILWNEAEALYLLEGWDDDNACSVLALVAEQRGCQVFVETYPQGHHRNALPNFKRKGGEHDWE